VNRTRVLVGWTLSAISAAMLLWPSPVQAKKDSRLDQVETLYRAGEREMLDADYAEAIELWSQAYDTLGRSKSDRQTRHLRSIIAANIAVLQIGTWERGLRPGDLNEARKVLQAYLLQYEAAAGKHADDDPDLNRVRKQLLEVEALMAGEAPPSTNGESGADDEDDEDDEDRRSRREQRREDRERDRDRDIFRSYPWERFDGPIILMGANWSGPVIQDTVRAPRTDEMTMLTETSSVDVRRHRGWGIHLGLWTRPRLAMEFSYDRRVWQAENAVQPYEFRSNDLSFAVTSDLLAIERDWAVRPVLMPFVRGVYTFGQRDYVNPTTLVAKKDEKIRGAQVTLGGHLGLLITIKKLGFMLRGGVGKPFYALWADGDRISLQGQYPKALRWEAGLTFAIPLD